MGVNVNLILGEFGAYQQKWVGYTLEGAAAPIPIANRPLGGAVYDVQFASGGPATYTHDDTLDAMIADLREAGDDLEAYSRISGQLNQYVHDHYLSIPLLGVGSLYAISDSVRMWQLGTGQYDINVRGLILP